MKIAVIDKKETILTLQNNAIKFEGQTIPLRLIDMLILNHKTTIQTKDILHLTKENITILLISYNNDNFSMIQSANTKNGELKLAQYNSQSKRLKFAKYYISKKILSHQKHLQTFGINIEDMAIKQHQIDNAEDITELMGIEGAFARLYFQHYFSQFPKVLHKGKRTKKPPQDPVNALLSYWYSLYYHIITTQLLSHGFEPSLGYLHTPFRTHNALASDLMEIFRAYINQVVFSIFEAKLLTTDDFTKKGGVYLKYEGRKKVWHHFIELVALLKPELTAEIAHLKKEILI